jgi:hypothetical protein
MSYRAGSVINVSNIRTGGLHFNALDPGGIDALYNDFIWRRLLTANC